MVSVSYIIVKLWHNTFSQQHYLVKEHTLQSMLNIQPVRNTHHQMLMGTGLCSMLVS